MPGWTSHLSHLPGHPGGIGGHVEPHHLLEDPRGTGVRRVDIFVQLLLPSFGELFDQDGHHNVCEHHAGDEDVGDEEERGVGLRAHNWPGDFRRPAVPSESLREGHGLVRDGGRGGAPNGPGVCSAAFAHPIVLFTVLSW